MGGFRGGRGRYVYILIFFAGEVVFFTISFILHRLESKTRPILTPYDGRCQWDSNLRTPACESPALPLYKMFVGSMWLVDKMLESSLLVMCRGIGQSIERVGCHLGSRGRGSGQWRIGKFGMCNKGKRGNGRKKAALGA